MRTTTRKKMVMLAITIAILPMTALGWFPVFTALIDFEVWLTNRVADPILFAFWFGLALPVIFAGDGLLSLVKHAGKWLPRAMQWASKQMRANTERTMPERHLEAEPFMPKLVVSRAPRVEAPRAATPAPEAKPAPAPAPAPAAAPAPRPASAIPPQPSALDIAMPNQVVQLAAQYDRWDKEMAFKLWEIAWLWNEWEPVSDILKNKPCQPTYLRLEAELEAGVFPGARKRANGWKDVELSRQMLVDYALAVGERPKFLFPDERNWLLRQVHAWQARDIALSDMDGFYTYGATKLLLYKTLQTINCDAVANELKRAMRAGECEGVARRQVGGIAFGFERIPAHAWRSLAIDWLGNISGRNVTFTDLRVKFRPGYGLSDDPLPRITDEVTPDFAVAAEESRGSVRNSA